jgi:hypothetical protein
MKRKEILFLPRTEMPEMTSLRTPVTSVSSRRFESKVACIHLRPRFCMRLASSNLAEHRRMTPVEAADVGSNPAPTLQIFFEKKNMSAAKNTILVAEVGFRPSKAAQQAEEAARELLAQRTRILKRLSPEALACFASLFGTVRTRKGKHHD